MKNQVYQEAGLTNVVYAPSRRSDRSKPNARNNGLKPLDAIIIRLLDIVISLIAIVLLAPTFLVIYLLLCLAERGDPVFSQIRLGFQYQEFPCRKFRTMRPNSDHLLKGYLLDNPQEARMWRDYHKLKKDPRVTLIGRVLRKTSLDELPQLFNVLIGEMSLVGPRPIMLSEIEKYGRPIRSYVSVRPGITGLWQIKGRSSLTYRQRVACDRLFVRKQSLGLYLMILVKTIPAVIMQKGSS